MSATKNRGLALLGGMLAAGLAGAPVALADDTELFVNYAGNAAPPNILFILDTSGSMDGLVESQAAYDPAASYAGACPADRVYWSAGADDHPTCDSGQWIEDAALTCAAAREAFASGAGRLTDRLAQYGAPEKRWKQLVQTDHTGMVECEDDRGRHGDGSSATHVYATDGDSDQRWSESPADEINWSGQETQTLYSANYLNWYYGPPVSTTRMQVVKDVASGLANSINGVNIGVMRFNADDGGRLVHPVSDVTENRAALLAAINGLSPSGVTPMAETLYEAARYFLGLPPHFADESVGVGAGGAYQTPVAKPCQKNFIVYLTDGEPSNDTDAATLAPALPGFASLAGPCEGSGDGTCLAELARYLNEIDLAPDLPGKQNVVTYTIGFTLDLPLLSAAAAQGGGQYYIANDTQSLSRVLTNIVTSILETQATFTAPAVSVNSFNRTQHLNDLFITVFQPTEHLHWPGNLKKYRLRAEDTTIVDADNQAAVDETGFFSPDARSFWSPEPDGRRVTQGGAANRLPSPGARRVFTYLPEYGNPLLVAATNAVRTDNGLLTAELLGVGDAEQRAKVIRFIRGEDVNDIDLDGSTSDARNQLGDPLHARPASLVYGGTPSSPDVNDAVVFFATNDGYLHAIDASSGVEKWAFVPPEFLADQARLLADPASDTKQYGIDGNLRLQVLADHDGIIDPISGEKVYLFFGLRRGGHTYYALDVTNPDAPSILWRLDGTDLPGLGQTWSSPVPTRIKLDSESRDVVMFAGGYDTSQDVEDVAPGPDGLGNSIYIVDSATGDVLWHGGNTLDATRTFPDMDYSIPADLKVIDLDSDGFADRIYAADMGGQVWRFDIFNGQPASGLVTGGVIARLGSAGLDSPGLEDARRFYYAPDVALAGTRDGTFLHIGIGSGFRAHPNERNNENRFYALRDHDPFRHLTQAEFNARPIITEDDLVDVTTDIDAVVETGSAGWMLRLREGEKVLAEARTFDNDVYFTSFTPNTAPDENDCEPRLGTNRLYVLSLFNGEPVTNLDGSIDDDELTLEDRAMEFRGSIASEVSFLFPSASNPASCVGDECRPLPVVCVDLFCFPTSFGNNPIRTFWRQESVD